VQWHKRYREASSEIVISYQVIDVEKGTVVKSDTITQRQVDRTQWVTYVGDEGMIPREVLAYVTTGDRPVATGEVLTSRATQAAAGMISSRIRQYFQ
jgi:hypothetical protein